MKAHQILLWVGSGIALTVVVAWALVQNHGHPAHVTQPELNRVHERIGEVRTDIKDLRTAIMDKLEKMYDNARGNPNQ